MASYSAKTPELIPDVLRLVFQQLAGDSNTLLNISLSCHTWSLLALPYVYQVVDISHHNNGEAEGFEHAYADNQPSYRPRNLVPRQRAFLRLMTEKPQLLRYVKSFTWTLKWLDFGEEYNYELQKIDYETWEVFGKMTNVTHLDLASLHFANNINYVRENPVRDFPQVRGLRLQGWMHRSLVRAILTSLDPRNLRSLALDYLLDEGALPKGEPMSAEFTEENARSMRSTNPHRGGPKGVAATSSNVF